MSLTPGTKLGPYEILAPLGAGGMGEVYRARDTRLDRTVAIKVLLAAGAQDPEFRARFEREAKAISQLSHPHICVLHDVGHEHGVDYLVLEYLEGETLAKRLEKGPLALDQALRVATEICDGLDKAHKHGITHRDLKPGNIMLTKSGAKLLDFGLAKSLEAREPVAPVEATESPTAMSPPLTTRGSILGTFQYMAPEQIEGQPADARSDIWAFGCLLYEALTGTHAFAGRSQASLVGAIMKDTPPAVSTVSSLSPPALDRIVSTCLAKDPDERWQSAADIARELKWIQSGQAEVAVRARPTGLRNVERVAWASVALALAAVAVYLSWSRPSTAAFTAGPPTHAVLSLGDAQALVPAFPPTIAISPDGKYLAYRGATQLLLRSLDEREARPLAGTDGGSTPFFSPDSRSLGFAVGSTIKRIALSGGAPTVVAPGGGTNTLPFRGIAWGDDDFIYYTPTVSAGLWRIPASGGAAEQLTTPDYAKGEKTHRWPAVLPGSKAVLFLVGTSRITSFDDSRIEALTLATKTRTLLVDGGAYPQYLPTGHLLYSRQGALLAIDFDPEKLAVRGSPVRVVDGTILDPAYGFGTHAVSIHGTIVYAAGGTSQPLRTLASVDRAGVSRPLPPAASNYSTGRVSPDGSRFAVQLTGATSQIMMVDLARGSASRLTFDWDNEQPIWRTDSEITITSNQGGGPRNLYSQSADGGGVAQRITTSAHEQVPWSWSPDGKLLVFGDTDPETLQDLWYLSLDDRKPHVLVKTPGADTTARLSPDGRWLAYQSNLSGRAEVYVQAFPAGGRRWQISTDGGTTPVWQRSGRELIFRQGAAVMAVSIAASADFQYGSPVKLFDSPQPIIDVLRDGRLLMLAGTPLPPVKELNVIVNWFDELKKKMMAGK